jgi:hypothetical protein
VTADSHRHLGLWFCRCSKGFLLEFCVILVHSLSVRDALIFVSDWLKTHESVAIWIEGIALLAIFIWDRVDASQQHKQTLAQMEIMENQARATETAALAASKSVEALINSERAWIIAELVPHAVRVGDKQWYRVVGESRIHMSTQEVLAGHHLRYKLRLTNMGRTPAQIFGFTIRYSCLGEGAMDLPENAGGNQASHRPFEHLLGGNGQAVEIEEQVDVGKYMDHNFDAIKRLEKTAVIHGSVKYRHLFSTTDDCYADFCYVYTVSEERLSSVGRHTRQRQQKASR